MKPRHSASAIAVAIAALTLQLTASASTELQLLPAGKFRTTDGRPKDVPHYFIDAVIAQRVIEAAAARSNPFVIDYEHQTLLAEDNGQPAPAAAWFTRLEWREGQGLYATDVDWTARARQMVEAKEYRFLSPVFGYDKNTGAVLFIDMAAITNSPALDGMQEIARRAAARYGHDHNQETDMNDELLKKLLAATGLPETASEADVLAAAASLKTKADKTVELETQVAALKQQTTVDPGKYVSIESHNKLAAELAVLNQRRNEEELSSTIRAAVTEGRLPTDDEKWAREFAQSHGLGALKESLSKRPAIAALVNQQSRSRAGGGDGDPLASAKAEFEGSAQLRDEFIDIETFTAWRKANAAGRIKILGRTQH